MRTSSGPFLGYGWQLVGGDLALDLVNTVAWQRRPERTTDCLVDPSHLADWLAVAAPRHRTRSTVTPADLAGDRGLDILAAVRKLRDAGLTVLTAYVDHRAPAGWAIEVIRERYYTALAQADVPPQLPLRHQVLVDGPEQIVPLLGLALGDLSSRVDDLERLRRCADQECGWFFIDTSRNRTRRWCDPGDCGNRNRVKAFAARHRSRVAVRP